MHRADNMARLAHSRIVAAAGRPTTTVSSRIPTVMSVLVLLALMAIGVQASARSGLYNPQVSSSQLVTDLLKQAASAYAVNNDLDVGVTTFSPASATVAKYLGGGYDLAVTTIGITTAQQAAYPNVVSFPFIGNAVVPIFNLPASAGLTPLILPMKRICDIERGNITRWNDPRLQAVNPMLVLPDLGITIFHLSISAATSDAITSMCSKISPEFKALIGRSMLPTWPTAKYNKTALGANGDILSSLVIDTVGGYALSTLQNVVGVGARQAVLVNTAGISMTATINAISLNILELASTTLATGVTSYDLTNPTSPNAWPMCTLLYLWIDVTNPVTTCTTKAAFLKWVIWLYQDASFKTLAEAIYMAVVPDLYVVQTDLITTLEDTVKCQGSQLITSTTSNGILEGFGSAKTLLISYLSYYTASSSSDSWVYHVTTERLATQRVVASEIDIGIFNTRQLSAEDTTLMASASGVYVPAFYSGIVITFTLPSVISAKVTAWTALTSTLPAMYPLALDMETVAAIFLGLINSWTDPAIVKTNPQIKTWFDAYPAVSTKFTPVACCTSASDPMVAGQLLLQSLNTTALAQSAAYSSYFVTPVSFAQQVLNLGANFTMIEQELRMSSKATTTQAAGGSAISYRKIVGAATDQTTEFRIVQTVGGVTESLAAQPSNFKTCATVGWATGKLADPSYVPAAIAGCYPLSTALSFGLPLAFTGTACTRGNRSLNLFNWIATTDALSDAAINGGMLRLADFAAINNYTTTVLNSATCDGETLLITLPTVWAVNSAISGFGIAVFVIGLVVFLASAVILVMYHQRSVLRSSSVPFLGMILFGLAVLITSASVWASPITGGSCSSFMWLGSLGFSLVFVPFFAKTYRIYMIFSRQKLQVVKMSNKRLMIAVAAMIGAELALLLAWSLVSPLKPITYLRNISGTYHQATHCSVDTEGMKFVIVEAVYKAVLLIAGTMLAFSTRKVSTAFNESSAIAFSIYNVLFSSVIVGVIIYFVSAFEDTLILLFLFLIFWVTLVTWALLFGQKFYVMFSQTEEDAATMSKLSSLQTEQSAGFSFVSVINMPANMIKSYVAALEGQLGKARKQLSVVLGTTGQGIGAGAKRAPTQTTQKQYVIPEAALNRSLPGQIDSGAHDPSERPVNYFEAPEKPSPPTAPASPTVQSHYLPAGLDVYSPSARTTTSVTRMPIVVPPRVRLAISGNSFSRGEQPMEATPVQQGGETPPTPATPAGELTGDLPLLGSTSPSSPSGSVTASRRGTTAQTLPTTRE